MLGSHFAGAKHAEQYLILMQTKALLSASEEGNVGSLHHAHSLREPGSSVVCTEVSSLTHQSCSSCLLVFRNPMEAAREQEPVLGGWTRDLKLQQLDLGQKHQSEKPNSPKELLRPYMVAVTGRMFVFHLLQGTAQPAVVSHLKAVLGLLFRTDSEERVPLGESLRDFPQFGGFP